MLVGCITLISALAALAVCAAVGGFAAWNWLWMLPLLFVAGFLVLAGLWFLLLVILASRVRMDEQKEEDDPFYRKVMHLTFEAVIFLLRVHIDAEGLEKAPKDGRFLLVCNHLNDTDPVILLHSLPKCQLAFISKRENDQKFIIGPFLRQIGCQPINRENDREALKTILTCIRMIKEDKASIAVFPEGWVSLDRKLHPFRPGVFKIAQKAQVPILVCTLQDSFTIFPNALRLKPSYVKLHVLELIPAEELKGVTTAQIAARVHKLMADDLGPDLVLQEST